MKPFLGLFFSCANAYTRAYQNQPGTAYLASCPQCGRPCTIGIANHGASARQFMVSCQNNTGALLVTHPPTTANPH